MEAVVLSQFPEAEVIGQEGANMVDIFAAQVNMHIGGAVLFALIGFSLVIGIEIASKAVAKSKKSN